MHFYKMRVHFIAIGGSAMHNLAIALNRRGFEVTGSDDEIFEPSKGRLQKEGILPETIGWDSDKVHSDINAIILGMHAKTDNPELLKAKELGLKIYSYPEYIYEQTKNKTRYVIGGSHGKTTVTSMILHCLNFFHIQHDYMVGAQLNGYDCMVQLSEEAPIVILEGDEYLSSPIDRRPKFHLYKPHVAVITGIAWDHINVFPTWENYVSQFSKFIEVIEPNGTLYYYENDTALKKISKINSKIKSVPYSAPHYNLDTNLITIEEKYPVQIIGKHNVENLQAAFCICQEIGISKENFYKAMFSFTGASKRLEKIAESNSALVYKDFAHSPSKLRATTKALKEQFPERKLIAVMELHTFSSLNKEFLPHYENSMNDADEAFVYYNPKVLEHKKLPSLDENFVKECFKSNVKIFTDSHKLISQIQGFARLEKTNLLIMTSGNLNGNDLNLLASQMV